MGESNSKPLRVKTEPIALDTFGGRIHVKWDPGHGNSTWTASLFHRLAQHHRRI